MLMMEEERITNKDGMLILKNFVDTYGLAKSQIDSYNYFIQLCDTIVTSFNPITITTNGQSSEVYFENLIFRHPVYKDSSQEFRKSNFLYPHEARSRNITYSSQMFVDIIVK